MSVRLKKGIKNKSARIIAPRILEIGYSSVTIKLNPSRLQNNGTIRLIKKTKNSLLHSPRIIKEDVNTSENSVVMQPINIITSMIAPCQPDKTESNGMLSSKEDLSKTTFANRRISINTSADKNDTRAFCLFVRLEENLAISTQPFDVLSKQ